MKKVITIMLAATFLAACQESLEEKCAKEARAYTLKNCPARLGDNITMDSMAFDATTHTLRYYYRLSGAADSVGGMSAAKVKETLLKDLRNSTTMKIYKDADYSFGYTYRSEKNPETVLYDVVLTAEDYK